MTAAHAQDAQPGYRIDAVRYATFPELPTSTFIGSAADDESMDAAAIIWVIRGNGRTIMFDSGFHRVSWFDAFTITDFIRPDAAVGLLGITAADVTDIIISHAHWDHMGGIDLFPNATVWIQKAEYDYYTSDAWQPGGNSAFIDPEDIVNLARKNVDGKVQQIDGDNVEIMPGITVYTGARHTHSSQYARIGNDEPIVLASDNCYLYRNMEENEPIAILFSPEDREANRSAIERMQALAGAPERVVPGHDPAQFDIFPSNGPIARIK
jgi:glyoxylase-like metal-dependent hydrolase (beta-lactamase superfamily II)